MHWGRRRRVRRAAIDSTGLECTCASGYFIKRRVRTTEPWKTVRYHRFAKLGVVCDTGDHFILAYQTGRGPRPDVDEFRPLVADVLRRARLSLIVADAGYDSEANHAFARDHHRLRTVIPAKHGRPTNKPARGRYRRLMQVRFASQDYSQRSQVETVISMLKRRQGSYVRGRTYPSQCRDLHLIALTHNIMILLCTVVFYRATREDYSQVLTGKLVRETGLEPARYCYHQALNLARLPISPFPREISALTESKTFEPAVKLTGRAANRPLGAGVWAAAVRTPPAAYGARSAPALRRGWPGSSACGSPGFGPRSRQTFRCTAAARRVAPPASAATV